MVLQDLPQDLPISEEDWQQTPPAVRAFILQQQELLIKLAKRVEELEARLGQNSQNSSRPPSSDSPYERDKRGSKGTGKPGAKKGHKGHQQSLLKPTEVIPIPPKPCECGGQAFENLRAFYTHQHIELPEIRMEITHFVLQEGECAGCGKTCKGVVPEGFQVGYGPRLTGLIGELSASQRSSRSAVKEFCQSVLGITISSGGIQRCVDRVSEAILPYYVAIAKRARSMPVNFIDETSWYQHGVLAWLWVMVNHSVAFFSIKASRSKKAFEELIGHWAGILVSDGYGGLPKMGESEADLPCPFDPQIALGLAERKDHRLLQVFGERIRPRASPSLAMGQRNLQRKEKFPHGMPNCHLIDPTRGRKDEAGRLAKHL